MSRKSVLALCLVTLLAVEAVNGERVQASKVEEGWTITGADSHCDAGGDRYHFAGCHLVLFSEETHGLYEAAMIKFLPCTCCLCTRRLQHRVGKSRSKVVTTSAPAADPQQPECARTCHELNCDNVGIRYGKYCGVGHGGCPGTALQVAVVECRNGPWDCTV